MSILNSRNLYKLIVIVFLLFTFINVKDQLITLNTYNKEIATLDQKIANLKDQINSNNINYSKSKEDNENLARKDLKMYYPNETPYIGY